MSELVELAAELIGIPSTSHHETAIADRCEAMLSGASHLELRRIGDNVLARTSLGRSRRVVVAGHLDTVSVGEPVARLIDDELWGLGAADMKGSIAVMLQLALELEEPSSDLTWIFYAREEVGREHSGLLEVEEVDASWLDGDVAILGEPTSAAVEAGCQGTLRMAVEMGGVAAHTARPFMGANALHRLAPVLEALAAAQCRTVVLDGVEYAEQLQVVGVEGGTGRNVVPDAARLVLNHRFAPDRSGDEAVAWVRGLVEGLLDPAMGDRIEMVDLAEGAMPHLDDPLLHRLVELTGRPVTGKVGWTDVATFAARGVPATNFGAGDPLLAHLLDERVPVADLDALAEALRELLA